MTINIKSFWPAAIALAVATILFCLPGDQFHKEGWLEKIFIDKWVHVGLFALLVGLWCLPIIHRIGELTRLRNLFIWITVGFMGYGIVIEFVQGNFIPYRTLGVDDMVADAVGCGIGYLFASRQLRKHKLQR